MSSVLLLSFLMTNFAEAGEVRFSGEGHAFHPVWSHDGRHLAFEVNRFAGDVELFIAGVTGDISDAAVKVSLPASGSAFGGSKGNVAANPTWHKDGFALFEAANQGGKYRLYFVQPGGGTPSEFIPTTQMGGNLTFATISADGQTAAFISDQTGHGDVYALNTQNSAMTQLTSHDGTESFPMYKASGNELLFTRKKQDAEDAFSLSLSTYDEKLIGSGAGDQTRPIYAGNTLLYFSSERGLGTWDLIAIAPDGAKMTIGKSVKLPHRSRPAISPDGKWVAYVYDDPSKAGTLLLSRVDGSKTVRVPTSFEACGEPALTQANGRTVLAFTALPASGADWRFLYLMDISGKL